MKKYILAHCAAFITLTGFAQTTGQWLFQKKAATPGYTPFGVSATNNYVFGLNGSGVPTMIDPATFSEPVDMGNILWVSAEGSDGSGERGNPGKPFETLQAAHDAAIEGDHINVIGDSYQFSWTCEKTLVVIAPFTTIEGVAVDDGTLIIECLASDGFTVASGAGLIVRNCTIGSVNNGGTTTMQNCTVGSMTGNGGVFANGCQFSTYELTSGGTGEITLYGSSVAGDMTIYNPSAVVNLDRVTMKGGIVNAAFSTLAIDAYNTVTADDTAGSDLSITGYGNCFGCTDGAGGAAWGSITGTLSSQTDLQSALDAKEDAFSKGNISVGTGLGLTGSGTGRLYGSGNISLSNTLTLQQAITNGGTTLTSGSVIFDTGSGLSVNYGSNFGLGANTGGFGLFLKPPSSMGAARTATFQNKDYIVAGTDDITTAISALNWSTILLAGNSSGGNRPIISDGDFIRFMGTSTNRVDLRISSPSGQFALTLPNETGTLLSTVSSAGSFPTLNQNTTGSAAKWTTTRNIAATGDITWNVNVDGGGDATAAAAIGSGVIVNADVNASAAIDGSKITSASTSAVGVVELATDGENASGVVVQGNDARINRDLIATVGSGQTTTSTTPVTITGASVTLAASTTYDVELTVLAECSSTSGGFGLTINGSAAATYVAARFDSHQSAGNYPVANISAYDGGTAATTCTAANTVYYMVLRGRVVNGGSSSTLSGRIFRGGGSGTITIRSATIVATQR